MLLLICGGFLVEAIVLDTKYRVELPLQAHSATQVLV